MGCDIVFEFTAKGPSENEGSKAIVIRNSDINSKDFNILSVAKELLKNKDKVKDIATYYLENKYSGVHEVTEKILNTKGVMGNVNLAELKTAYPNIPWYTSKTIYNPEILLVNLFKVKGREFYGRVIDGDREVFVIQANNDNIKNLEKFNNFLKLRDELIMNQDIIELNKELKKISEKKGFKSNVDLLLDYQLNSKEYLKNELEFRIINSVLDEYTNTNYIHNPDPFSNFILNNRTKDKKSGSISKGMFNSALKKYHPEIFEKYQISEDYLSKSKSEEGIIKQIFEEVFINDPYSGIKISFSEAKGKSITFTISNLISDVYGMTYETIINDLHLVEDMKYPLEGNLILEIKNHSYRGYNIYYKLDKNGNKEYFVSLNVISPYVTALNKKLTSLEEVKQYIDKEYNTNNSVSINYCANLAFKKDYTTTPNVIENSVSYFAEGTKVKSLGITLQDNVMIDPEDEQFLYLNKDKKGCLLKDFKEEFRKQIPELYHLKFDSEIDTSEKAGVFIYLLNERIGLRESRNFKKKENIDKLDQIFKDIENAENHPNYFYIVKIRKSKTIKNRKLYDYQVIQTTNGGLIEFESAHYQRPKPVINELNQIKDVFESRFGLKIEILNSREIPKHIAADAKAWIENGIIYVNGTAASSSDLVHEYTHLLLGVLKATDFDKYEKLIEKISKSNDDNVKKKRGELRIIYPNLSNTDLNEEVFAELYAEYLVKKDIPKLFSLEEVNEPIADALKSKFNIDEADFKEMLSGLVSTMFSRLTNFVSGKDNIKFGNTSIYRKASRLIEEYIKNGQIKEIC